MDDGDEILCSGSLLSTRDNSFKPYFLTAGHCVTVRKFLVGYEMLAMPQRDITAESATARLRGV
jgi:galactose-1-phosphate uridylyltransferase